MIFVIATVIDIVLNKTIGHSEEPKELVTWR